MNLIFLPVHSWGSHKSREESNYTLSHFLVFRSSPLWTISSLWVIEIRGFCPAPVMRRHGEFGESPFPLFPFPQACGWNELIWFVWTDYFDWKTRVDISPCLWEWLKIKTLEHLVFVVLPIMWLWCLKSSQMWRINHAMEGGSWKPSGMWQYPMLEFHLGLELPCDLHIQILKWCGVYKHVLSLRPRAFPETFALALTTPAWPKV